MDRKRQAFARDRQKKLERRRQREGPSGDTGRPRTLSRELIQRLDDAHALIGCGKYVEAEALLSEPVPGSTNNPEIVEALLFLYQTTGDHERCCQSAKRLMGLRPHDPEARLMYAQESMFCGRVAIALLNYRQFMERWPDHPRVAKAKNAIELLVPETENRLRTSHFSAASGLEWLALHEASLSLLQSGEFTACATKCLALLAKAPTFMPARNNLAIAYFQSGRSAEAVAVVEETRRLFPGNRFADVALAKLYFLTARVDDAQRCADQILSDPPTQQDALIATLEMLSFLGRDEDIVMLAEWATRQATLNDQSRATAYHYLAYGKCRLGDQKAARVFWKKCLKLCSHYPEARENMRDLDSGDGHAPWANALGKWIPKNVLDNVIKTMPDEKPVALARYPAISALTPPLLDRGDPRGREVAMRLAMADGSPPMLAALMHFAMGSRGSDSMRLDALLFLQKKGLVDSGPHHLYRGGKWTDIQLFTSEILTEPEHIAGSPRVRELLNTGIEALRVRSYDVAEASLTKALDEEPDNCTAVYNLCVIWSQRDGKAGKNRARARLEQLHQLAPDYPFAVIALAQFAAFDGDFAKAHGLLSPVFQAPRLHISAVSALFTAQIQIALEERDLDAATRALSLLRQFSDEDDTNVQEMKRRIDKASKVRPWRSLFSMFRCDRHPGSMPLICD